GAYYGSRIIQFREKLGGFLSIEQVGDTRGLPDSVFQNIKDALLESSIVKKLLINRATVKQLSRHPYVTWKQAELLVAFRGQHGAYHSVADIQKIRAFRKEDIDPFAPYLDFSE
ncbi:MAG: helix-hairpin-helix domain-containing protein, partial [Bacteroidota bacterium]